MLRIKRRRTVIHNGHVVAWLGSSTQEYRLWCYNCSCYLDEMTPVPNTLAQQPYERAFDNPFTREVRYP